MDTQSFIKSKNEMEEQKNQEGLCIVVKVKEPAYNAGDEEMWGSVQEDSIREWQQFFIILFGELMDR